MRALGSSEGLPGDLTDMEDEPHNNAKKKCHASYNQEERIPGHVWVFIFRHVYTGFLSIRRPFSAPTSVGRFHINHAPKARLWAIFIRSILPSQLRISSCGEGSFFPSQVERTLPVMFGPMVQGGEV